MNTLVMYHADCADGYLAAYAMYLKFREKAEYIPSHYQTDLPDVEGKDVYMVDFSVKPEQLIEMSKTAKSITIIDHHKTAIESIEPILGEGLFDCLVVTIFDQNKSGCMLAYEFVFANSIGDQSLYAMFEHVQDRDLWRFNLDKTKAFSEAFNKHVVSTSMPFFLFSLFDSHSLLWGLIGIGEKLLVRKNEFVKELAHGAIVIDRVAKVWLGSGNYKEKPPISELGNYLCNHCDVDYADIIFKVKDGLVHSLRSIGDFDVSAIALKHGGGGHKNAAGYKE